MVPFHIFNILKLKENIVENFLGYVYLVDDDVSMRQSIEMMLVDVGYIVHAYANPEEFLKDSMPLSPAVVLLDMKMPTMSGVELQAKLNDMGRSTPIVFISGVSSPSEIVYAFKAGAIDFLFKPFNLEDLLSAIIKGVELDRQNFKAVSDLLTAKQRYQLLTPREAEVCELLVQGLMNKDVAKELGTTDATIKVHKARVMEKMKADSLQSLVRIFDQVVKN